MGKFEYIDACIDEYLEAYEDVRTKPDVAANFAAIWSLVLMLMRTGTLALQIRPAALKHVAPIDSKTRQIIDGAKYACEKDEQETIESVNDQEMVDLLDDMLATMNRSLRWAHLADYYLAMKYIWNIVDNDLGWGFNRRVGFEMLYSFASVGNIYAMRFLKHVMSFGD